MKIHLVDGTFELFRAYFALPSISAPDGREVAAVRGLIQTLLILLRQPDVTHVACAFDSVIRSFRNDLFTGYKTGEGTPPELLSQFELAEQAAACLGLVVWPMVEVEADDALGAAANRWWDAPGVEQVVLCSPDKDLAQAVTNRPGGNPRPAQGHWCWTRPGCGRNSAFRPIPSPTTWGSWGTAPTASPAFPAGARKAPPRCWSVTGISSKSPRISADWAVTVRGAKALAASLTEHQEAALLYRQLATLRLDVPLPEDLAQLEWQGVRREPYRQLCGDLGFGRLMDAPGRWEETAH